MMRLPDYCYSCGAYLMGGATEHKEGCEVQRLIDDVLNPPEELLLQNLTPGTAIALEGIAPPGPFYLAGVVREIMVRCVIVEMIPLVGESLVRLHANREGRFVTDTDQPVRVFRRIQT